MYLPKVCALLLWTECLHALVPQIVSCLVSRLLRDNLLFLSVFAHQKKLVNHVHHGVIMIYHVHITAVVIKANPGSFFPHVLNQ